MDRIGVWHRDDLRVRDNISVSQAMDDGKAVPIFIFDPRFYESDLVSDGRIRFMHESIEELDQEYDSHGADLSLLHGNPKNIIQDLLSDGILDKLYFNSTVTSGYKRRRDKRMESLENTVMFEDDAIVRSGNSREGWRDQAEDYFESDIVGISSDIDTDTIETDTTIDDIENKYGIDDIEMRRHKGGCITARDRLDSFVKNISKYVGGISPPYEAEERTSQLSPYFNMGCVSLRQAYKKSKDEASDTRAINMFISRLFWNQHFTQKLYDNKSLRDKAVNPVFRGMNRSTHENKLHKRWKRGLTGYPMVDASMRALSETGWMNFRMRAMCASFYTYILRCWWKKGADWFYRKLVDADPAINYAQWQMQSGLVGVHPLRIYNPRKQVRDNDPEGKFIKKYIPELRDLPSEYLDQPEKTPLSVQEDTGVHIGEDYPYPVVEFENRRDDARDTWGSLNQRAMEALRDPEVFKRASLSEDSKKRIRKDPDEFKNEEQASIEDFMD